MEASRIQGLFVASEQNNYKDLIQPGNRYWWLSSESVQGDASGLVEGVDATTASLDQQREPAQHGEARVFYRFVFTGLGMASGSSRFCAGGAGAGAGAGAP